MTVKTWVCNICEDPYIGEDRPTHCPFCGAPSKYIVDGKEFKEPAVGELTDSEKNNIIAAIKLEVGNANFYFCGARTAQTLEHRKRFKALGKVEAEHATLLAKMIKSEKPTIDRNTEGCPTDDAALVKEAFDREDNAIKKYSQFLEEATDKRVKQVFASLVEIETTHLELEKEEIEG
ncbi:ferritin family protein [Nanoarchaeota archaeon]